MRDIANDLMDKYEDERAAKTDWSPLLTTSANFDTHKLHINKKGQYSFRPTWGTLMFSLTFTILGLFIYTITYLATYNNFWLSLLCLLPLVFVVMGLVELKTAWTPLRVKIRNGKFILGWGRDDFVRLEEISSLQLLPYQASIRGPRYLNYQLNLVLSGGARKNIVSYYHQEKAVQNAEQLAEHLDIRLWNGLDLAP